LNIAVTVQIDENVKILHGKNRCSDYGGKPAANANKSQFENDIPQRLIGVRCRLQLIIGA